MHIITKHIALQKNTSFTLYFQIFTTDIVAESATFLYYHSKHKTFFYTSNSKAVFFFCYKRNHNQIPQIITMYIQFGLHEIYFVYKQKEQLKFIIYEIEFYFIRIYKSTTHNIDTAYIQYLGHYFCIHGGIFFFLFSHVCLLSDSLSPYCLRDQGVLTYDYKHEHQLLQRPIKSPQSQYCPLPFLLLLHKDNVKIRLFHHKDLEKTKTMKESKYTMQTFFYCTICKI